jgi:hypothetical protein
MNKISPYMGFYNNQHSSGEKRAYADKMAKASFYMGASAVLVVLFPAITLFLAFPFGILAVLYEKQASKNETSKITLTSYGKNLGTAALFCIVVEILLALVLIVAWYFQL